MRSIIFACLVALAVTSAFERSFQPKFEYHYKFDGLILSGLPTFNSELSQTRISTRARIQAIDDRYIQLQLINIQVSASHLPETEQMPTVNSLEQRELSNEHQQLLELPVRAQLRNGLISEIQFDKEDAEWSKNVKRAVLNMLSFNPTIPTDEESQLNEQSIDEENTSFFTNEKTIEGDCQVAYTIVRENQKTIITKSINFEKCVSRPEVSYGLRHSSECAECDNDSQYVRPQTVYTYTLENNLLKESEVRSLYTVNFNGQEIMKTETRSKLTYEEAHHIKNQIKKVNGEKEELIYSVRWEQLLEDFYKNGDKAEFNPFEKFPIETKIELIRSLTEQVQEYENNMPETTHQFARLVSILRTTSVEQLEKIHETLYKKADKKIQSFIEHALSSSGTKNTIQHLIRHIEKKDITPLKAAQLLKSIQETTYPSQRIADLLIELAQSRVAQNEEIIRQSAWLAAGAVVRGIVVDTADQYLLREGKRDIKQKYIRIFMQQFNEAESTYEKVLALKTLGNAGIDLSVYELNEIIVDNRQPLPVRKEAIDALRLLKDVMPRKVQKVLLPVYKNRQYSPELRMAALWRLMETRPEEQLLVQVVSQMEKETNKQVAAFTYQILNHFAKSTNPCYQHVAYEASRLLTFTRYQPQVGQLSTFAKLPMFAREILSGAQFDFAAMFEKNSFLPKELSASLESVFGGSWNKYLAQIGFSQQYLDRVFLNVLQKLEVMQKESRNGNVVRGRRLEAPINFVKDLAKKLNIQSRAQLYNDKDAFAMTYLRYKDMDYVLLPIDSQTIENLIEKFVENGKLDLQEVRRSLNQNTDFEGHHAGYFYEVIRKLPTTIGLPLTITGKVPTVFSVEGQFSSELKSTGLISLEVRPSSAATHVFEMRMLTPIFEQGIKSLQSARIFVPLKVEATVSVSKNVEITYKITVPENQKSIIALSTRPVVFLRFPGVSAYQYVEAEERTVVIPQWQQKTQEIEWVKKLFGIEFAARGNVLSQWTFESMLLAEQDIEFTIENKEQSAEFNAVLVVDMPEKANLNQVKFENVFEKEFDQDEEVTETRRTNFHKMVREVTKEQGYKQRISLKLEAPENKFVNVVFVTICDKQARICKFENQIKRSPIAGEHQEWIMNLDMVAARPVMPSSLRQLREQPHREVQISMNAKWGAQKKNQINLNAQLQQSKEQKKYEKTLSHTFNGIPEYELLVKAARLNQLNIVAQYKLNQETENTISRLFELVKVYNFWTLSTNQQDNEDRRVALSFTVEPINRQYVNITVQTPEQYVEMNNIQTEIMYLPSIAQRSMRHQINSNIGSVCKVENNQIRTFDDLLYKAPITTCGSLIVKDCSTKATFAVSVRKVEKSSKKMIAQITRQHEIVVLQLVDDEMMVKVDGKTIDMNSLENYDIELVGEKVAIVQLPEGEVRFDGYTIKTYMPTVLMNNQLCGLCGNNDDEMNNEFRMADNEETDNLEQFHRSYMIKDENCDLEEKRLSEKKNYKKFDLDQNYSSDSEENEDYEAETQNTRQTSNSHEKQFVKKTQIKEFAHRVCFSLEPVQKCRRGYEEDNTSQKKIRFTCLPRHNSEARRLLKEARDQVLSLVDYPVSYVKPIEVPTACVAY